MRASRIGVFAVMALPLTVSVVAHSLGNARMDRSVHRSPQAPAAQPPPQAPPSSPRWVNRQRQAPCWRVAGIAPQLVNQRWHIEDNAKGRINAVCTDPALTAEKRREKIQEINAQTEQEFAKIIPAKQLEAFKACQAERDQERAKRQGAMAQKELGPCGGVIPPEPGGAAHQHQPGNPSKE